MSLCEEHWLPKTRIAVYTRCQIKTKHNYRGGWHNRAEASLCVIIWLHSVCRRRWRNFNLPSVVVFGFESICYNQGQALSYDTIFLLRFIQWNALIAYKRRIFLNWALSWKQMMKEMLICSCTDRNKNKMKQASFSVYGPFQANFLVTKRCYFPSVGSGRSKIKSCSLF